MDSASETERWVICPVCHQPNPPDDYHIYALDAVTGGKLWDFETEGYVSSSPALVDTTIYVGSEDGRLYAVDAATGEKLWDILTGGKITSSPAVADGAVYIGSHDGNLYAIK